MSDSQAMGGSLTRAWRVDVRLPPAPLARLRYESLGIVALCPLLLCVALWNFYPIIFYDTGAYMLQGLGGVFIMERSPVYSLLLKLASAGWSLWLVAVLQAVMTSFVMVQVARTEAPEMSLWRMLGIGAFLAFATGLPWYAGQIEPDILASLLVFSLYLLAFRAQRLGAVRCAILASIAALSAASHPAHLGLAVGLIVVIALVRVAAWFWRDEPNLPRPRFALAILSVFVGVGLILAANYDLTHKIFISRAGPVFLSARMMQDGIVKRLLDDTCPASHYKLCAYKDKLPDRADAWLWEPVSPFMYKLGRFEGTREESARIVAESLKRYPWMNFKAALYDTAAQFAMVQTGDGIGPQQWALDNEFKYLAPGQLTGYLDARQQRGEIHFLPINIVHVSVAALSLLGLIMLLGQAIRRRRWNELALPAIVLAALLGNAMICGVLSGPHGRYQSRIAWMPTFVLLLQAGLSPALVLRRRVESVT